MLTVVAETRSTLSTIRICFCGFVSGGGGVQGWGGRCIRDGRKLEAKKSVAPIVRC